MPTTKDLFLNQNLRCGGFYELSIQVCPSADVEPIRRYTDCIWSLENVEGPFDLHGAPFPAALEHTQHDGILHLGQYVIPFMTYNIQEDEPIETGFNWFDIYFHTAAIEHVFGAEYKVWTSNPRVPEEIRAFFLKTVKQLYESYPFQLAMVDFEISGMYYADSLKRPLHSGTTAQFFAGQALYAHIPPENHPYVTKVEEIVVAKNT